MSLEKGVLDEQPYSGGQMQMGPVSQQPVGYGMMTQTAVPPDLQYLATLDRINIHQVFHAVEVVLGWEINNEYRICNGQDQQFMQAREDTDCCTRQWCGTNRPFTINLSDMQGRVSMQLSRDLRCQGCCFPCCLQEMYVEFPPGNRIATIKEVWTCITPRYHILDAADQHLYTIEGNCCYCKCCADVPFKVMRPDGADAGEITKHWGGCREVFGGVNDFSITFAPGETVMNKAILLGCTFLVDFMYFERNK